MIISRKKIFLIGAAITFAIVFIGGAHVSIRSQSGRQKNMNAKPSPTPATRPRQTTTKLPTTTRPSQSATPPKEDGAVQSDDVVRVSSHLVPIPTTVIDARGAIVSNLHLEDFELTVDGQPKPISELFRAETPVRMAML